MTINYSVHIAGDPHLERGIYRAAVYNKNKVELVFLKNGEPIKTVSLSAGQRSIFATLQCTKDKIALFCNRLGIDEQQLEYDCSPLPIAEKMVYKVLWLKRKLVEAFVPVQWVIVYKKQGDSAWRKIIPDSKVFQADSFIIFENNKYYVFYEELKFKDDHGYLMVAELDVENARLRNQKVILHKKFHLSYPCVFKEENTYYMIPESGDANSIDLYECTQFPFEWKKKKTLVADIQAVDTTPLKTEKGWYLFTTEIVKGAPCNDELFIYKSDDLFEKPFEKLYDMPVVSDVSNARMAGSFFRKNGDILRVAQDCGKRYGHKVNINKVIQIEGGYKEELIETIEPDFLMAGFHTYNQSKDIIIGDMEIIRLDFYSLKRYTWRNLKRVFGFNKN